ncbi:MAG: helix-turn-helix transcriptional regulator [Candidatus Lokiarchaeota archaeon]|nr:helix-turn-helix transcriptional regulator [Candidatus Lokiarchaeota archaeon]
MWLGKFLDLEEDIKGLRSKIQNDLFQGIKKYKLTPLEFTILETIFNCKELAGYDLILNLNKHFAGTWEAQSGTIYPILFKLKRDGFLNSRPVKSPIGPIRKVYSLTEAGEHILKTKVNKNFEDQLKFMGNFLIELSSIYIQSHPKEEEEDKINEVQNLIKKILETVVEKIPSILKYKRKCEQCGSEMERIASFCSICGATLLIKAEEKNL